MICFFILAISTEDKKDSDVKYNYNFNPFKWGQTFENQNSKLNEIPSLATSLEESSGNKKREKVVDDEKTNKPNKKDE